MCGKEIPRHRKIRAVTPRRSSSRCRTLPGTKIRQVVDAALARGLDVRTVPSMNDLLDGTLDAYRVRRVRVEDLLRRTTATEHAAAVHETDPRPGRAHHRRRWLDRLRAGPPGLRARPSPAHPGRSGGERPVPRPARTRGQASFAMTRHGELRAHLANVASRAAMDRAHRDRAARRHLPRRRLQARADDGGAPVRRRPREHRRHAGAARCGRSRPASSASSSCPRTRPSGRSSVMGASKRVAEMLVADAARRTGRPYVSVRFGNVLGSNGSVVPIFQEQLEKSEPLTDHPSRDVPLLHDHPRGGVADPRCGRARPQRRPVRAGHGRADPDRRPGPRPRPARRARSGHAADGHRRAAARARSSTRSCSTTAEHGRADDGRQGPAGDPAAAARPTCENRSTCCCAIATGGRESDLRTALLDFASRSNDGSEDGSRAVDGRPGGHPDRDRRTATRRPAGN